MRRVVVFLSALFVVGCTAIASTTPAPSASTAGATPTIAPSPTSALVSATPVPSTATLVPTTAVPSPIASVAPAIGQRTKTSGCQVAGALPDSACTPGAILPVSVAQICVPGYAKNVRNVSRAEKDAVFAEYGVTVHSGATYEVDHLISLELGGSNDIANLWPEAANPTPGFHQKDRVENEVHRRVCSGTMTLTAAQHQIAGDWLTLWSQGIAGSADEVGDSSLDAESTATVAVVVAAATAADGASVAGHTYYLSSAANAKDYYCDTDPGWQKLSPSNLVHLSSLGAVQQQYPGRVLHAPC
jgi:hypothetical protein